MLQSAIDHEKFENFSFFFSRLRNIMSVILKSENLKNIMTCIELRKWCEHPWPVVYPLYWISPNTSLKENNTLVHVENIIWKCNSTDFICKKKGWFILTGFWAPMGILKNNMYYFCEPLKNFYEIQQKFSWFIYTSLVFQYKEWPFYLMPPSQPSDTLDWDLPVSTVAFESKTPVALQGS